ALAFLLPRIGIRRIIGSNEQRLRMYFVFFTAVAFHPLLRGGWTMITRQDYLPLTPLLAVALTIALFTFQSISSSSPRWRFVSMGVSILTVTSLGVLAFRVEWLADRPNRVRQAELAAVLNLTAPGEYVM